MLVSLYLVYIPPKYSGKDTYKKFINWHRQHVRSKECLLAPQSNWFSFWIFTKFTSKCQLLIDLYIVLIWINSNCNFASKFTMVVHFYFHFNFKQSFNKCNDKWVIMTFMYSSVKFISFICHHSLCLTRLEVFKCRRWSFVYMWEM